jgi:hypothetical protein
MQKYECFCPLVREAQVDEVDCYLMHPSSRGSEICRHTQVCMITSQMRAGSTAEGAQIQHGCSAYMRCVYVLQL